MAIPPGSYTFGPSNGSLVVKTTREGMAKKVGHDLIIDVTSWGANVTVGDDPSATNITADFDVNSFSVRDGVGGVKPLSDGDKADIKKNITQKIITSPKISFKSNSVSSSGSSGSVRGDLTIMGKSAPATLQLSDAGGGRVRGTATLNQTSFGIKPFSAMMGALKVADQVQIELEVAVPQG
jgi:polyisoprenoid-binding protein YceI